MNEQTRWFTGVIDTLAHTSGGTSEQRGAVKHRRSKRASKYSVRDIQAIGASGVAGVHGRASRQALKVNRLALHLEKIMAFEK